MGRVAQGLAPARRPRAAALDARVQKFKVARLERVLDLLETSS